MRHSTTSEAPVLAKKSPARVLAATVAAALVAGGLSFAAAAPASAAVTDSIVDGEFSWKISEQVNNHLSVKAATGGASVEAVTGIFTFTGGTGTVDIATGVADVRYVGTARSSFSNPVGGAEVYSLTVSNPEVTVNAAGAGEIVADVAYSVGSAAPVSASDVVVTRFSTSDSTPFTRTGSTGTLSDTPSWAGVMPPGGADATELGLASTLPLDGKAFAKEFLTFLKPSGLMAHFYASGSDPASASNLRKPPAAFTATADFAAASITASITSSSPKEGVKVAVSGDGFRGVTNAGDAGIYVGIAPAGGLPSVSSPSGISAFAAAAYLPAAALSTGAFATTITVPAAKIVEGVSYAVYTWQAHSHSNTTQDTVAEIPISFASVQWKTTTIAIAPSVPSATVGTPVTLNAAVPADATGSVEFFDGTSSLGSGAVSSGVATLAVSSLAVGTHSITASYSGDNFYRGLVSSAASIAVTKSASTVALALSTGSATFGSVATATATVTPAADGTITFSSGTTVLGTVALAGGVASLPIAGLPVGSHPIVATYSGTSTTDAAASAAATFTVTKLTPKVSVAAKAFKKSNKPKVTVSVAKLANGSYATGKVAIYVAGKAVKTVTLKASAKGKVSITLPKKYSKKISVKAKFLGSSTVLAKTSASKVVGVKKQ